MPCCMSAYVIVSRDAGKTLQQLISCIHECNMCGMVREPQELSNAEIDIHNLEQQSKEAALYVHLRVCL